MAITNFKCPKCGCEDYYMLYDTSGTTKVIYKNSGDSECDYDLVDFWQGQDKQNLYYCNECEQEFKESEE